MPLLKLLLSKESSDFVAKTDLARDKVCKKHQDTLRTLR